MNQITQNEIELEITVIEEQIESVQKFNEDILNTMCHFDHNEHITTKLDKAGNHVGQLEMDLYQKRAELLADKYANEVDAIVVSMENKSEYITGSVKFELQFDGVDESEIQNRIENHTVISSTDMGLKAVEMEIPNFKQW